MTSILQGSAQNTRSANEYAELKRLIKQRGLLDKQPAYYTYKILLTIGLLALSLTILVVVDSLWLQLLNAVFLAFIFTQIGLIGHDAGHQQVFRSPGRNDVILLVVNFLIGLDRSWWLNKHNRHHVNPNDLDLDLDVNLPLIAFTEGQALGKNWLYGAIVKYQAFLFFPLLVLEAYSLRADGTQYLLRRRDVKYPAVEALLLAAHILVYLGLLFYLLAPWHAALFIVVHQSLTGIYMGSVFATNHKGMLMLGKGSRIDFLRQQVLTSRNVTAHPVTDFCFGGLNYQIEHHLFPNLPRNNLRKAQEIVRPFCRERGISYHETGVVRSYREVLQHLHRVSAPLRRSRA